jgi:hypothetical protein
MARRTWLVVTIAEPYPVLGSHVNYADKPYDGPFYAPNSQWYYPPQERVWVEQSAAYQRNKGYTVTVTEEVR